MAGRFYGLGNNAVVIYGASGIVCAAWLGGALLRRGEETRARLVMAAVAAFTVIVAAWPGFGHAGLPPSTVHDSTAYIPIAW